MVSSNCRMDKCNIDGSFTAASSACGRMFRDDNANFLCCFAENLGGGTVYHVELSTIMRAVGIAFQRRWKNLWIETDYALVVMAFNNLSMIPCFLRNRWLNCTNLLCGMNFVVTHIYREGNRCADMLASKGLEIQGVAVWLDLPEFLNTLLIHDRLGLPNFRVSNA